MIRPAIFTILFLWIAAPTLAANEKAKADDDPIGRKLSERIGPFVQRLPVFWTTDKEYGAWKKEYERLTVDEKIRYCIFQLRNESWYETDTFYRDAPYSKEPEATASRELIKFGRSAIPQLLLALNSRVSTKIHPSRHVREPWLVQDAALDAVENIACRNFGRSAGVFKLNGVGDEDRQKIRKNLADWWEKNKGSDEVQWAKDALLSETTAHWESRGLAIDSLYYRLGKESYPFLAKAYHRLPKGRETADGFDETRGLKVQILQRLLKTPTTNEKSVFASALHDAPLWVRIDGAEGLQAIGDRSGLEAMVKETEDRLLKDFGSNRLDSEYCNITSFLVRCDSPSSREAVYKCLSGRNPYLRQEAIRAVPSLRMEKAVRALPDLFDDPFVLGGSYRSYDGSTERIVPPRRVCDEAAETFNKVVPDAPPFDGLTTETQQQTIDKLKHWWKENSAKLKWDEQRGVLSLPKKE